jgi:hypothetical protein
MWRGDGTVKLGDPGAICADREPKPYGLGTGGAEAPCPREIGQHRGEFVGKISRVTRSEQQACDAILYDLGKPTDVGGNHGDTLGHGLGGDETEALQPRGNDEDIEATIDLGETAG